MDMLDKAKEMAQNAVEAVKDAAGNVIESATGAKEAVGENVGAAAEGAQEAAGEATAAGSVLLGGLTGALGNVGEAVVGMAENVIKKDLDGDGEIGK